MADGVGSPGVRGGGSAVCVHSSGVDRRLPVHKVPSGNTTNFKTRRTGLGRPWKTLGTHTPRAHRVSGPNRPSLGSKGRRVTHRGPVQEREAPRTRRRRRYVQEGPDTTPVHSGVSGKWSRPVPSFGRRHGVRRTEQAVRILTVRVGLSCTLSLPQSPKASQYVVQWTHVRGTSLVSPSRPEPPRV